MYLKKCLALLVSAALAVSLLAACGSRALSNVMADLLTGLYDNVSVEVDNDLTAALKKAVSAGGTQEEILAALVENLNLSGVSIAFSSLGSGQQGQHGVTLTFQTGNDPDAAARIALAQWASVFGSLPKNGSYSASVAMIEADNGYYIAVDVEVTKAGSSGKDEPDPGYTVSEDGNTYNVTSANGLLAWAEAAQSDLSTNCTLADDIDMTGQSWTPIGNSGTPYTGTFDGNGKTITGLTVTGSNDYAGLFGYIGSGGTVKNVVLEDVQITSDNSSGYAGGVVGYSWGNIENCSVSGSVSSNFTAGGVVGTQLGGSITGCSSSATVKGTQQAGGIAGLTDSGAPLTGCYATGNVTLESSGSDNYFAGGVVGYNGTSTMTACYATGSVSGTGSGSIYVGGVTGNNVGGTLTACYHANGTVSGPNGTTGGVAGRNFYISASLPATITACYWGSNGQTQGIGYNQAGTGETTQVTDGDWQTAVTQMNAALSGKGWQYGLGGEGLPVLTQQP